MGTVHGNTNYGLGSDEHSLPEKDVCKEFCSEHEDKVIKYHCLNHDILGCSVCITLDHRTCDQVQYIPKVAKDLLNNKTFLDIDAELQRAQQKSNNVSEYVQHLTTTLENSCVATVEKFRQFKLDIVKTLNTSEAELEKKAASMKRKELGAILKVLSKTDQGRNTLQKMTDKVRQLKSDNQACDLYTYMVKIKDLLQPIEDQMSQANRGLSTRRTVIKFTPNNAIRDTLKVAFGLGEITLGWRLVDRAEYVKSINVRTCEGKKTCSITGSVILPGNKLLIADNYNDNLKLINEQDGQVKLLLQLPSKPWDIALIDDKQLAVTLPGKLQITFVRLTASPRIERYMDVSGNCRGVDYRDNKLAVSYTYPGKIEVLTLQGTILHTIPSRGNLFNDSHYVSFGRDTQTLYVTNYISNNVVYLKLDGTVKATYTDTLLQGPYNVITDSSGTVYVCGSTSGTVHQLSPDLQKIKVLLSGNDGLYGIRTMCYNELKGEIYICGWSDRLNVYKVIYESV